MGMLVNGKLTENPHIGGIVGEKKDYRKIPRKRHLQCRNNVNMGNGPSFGLLQQNKMAAY